ERARLGPGLRKPQEARHHRPGDVQWRGVADAAERALLGLDRGVDDGDVAVLLARHLEQGRPDAPQALAVGLIEQPGVDHEIAPLALDNEFTLHRYSLLLVSWRSVLVSSFGYVLRQLPGCRVRPPRLERLFYSIV